MKTYKKAADIIAKRYAENWYNDYMGGSNSPGEATHVAAWTLAVAYGLSSKQVVKGLDRRIEAAKKVIFKKHDAEAEKRNAEWEAKKALDI